MDSWPPHFLRRRTYAPLMDFGRLAQFYADLEGTQATLEKTDILAELFLTTDKDLLPVLVNLVRGQVFSDWRSKDLGVSSSLTREAISKATGIEEAQLEDWWRKEGDLGSAAARAVANRSQRTLLDDTVDVERVHTTLEELASYTGPGSQQRKVDAIAGLLVDVDPAEARYLVRTVLGTMRLGVGAGLVRDALAESFLDGTDEAAAAIERAYDVTNDFSVVAERVSTDGRPGLEELGVEIFRPIKPMLAHKADDLAQALAELGDADGKVHIETKYDGIRAKLHRLGTDLRMFTRRLEDVTEQFPDVVEAARDHLTADEYIVEAEVVGYDSEADRYVPFQQLSQRIKRKYDIEEMAEEIPVVVYVFDLLYLDGTPMLDHPLRTRLDRLDTILTTAADSIERADHLRTASIEDATAFYERTLQAGHEGVMVKNLDATYQPGSRVGYQLKVKSTMEPLDLVVTRVKWSEGRKSDFLGRPYLACLDTRDDSFKEIGRMHTGFTDADLEEFTELVEPLIQEVDGREARLSPEVVLEVSYEEIQTSPTYGSGYALRFPRFERIRHDLDPEDADTLDRIDRLYQSQQ